MPPVILRDQIHRHQSESLQNTAQPTWWNSAPFHSTSLECAALFQTAMKVSPSDNAQ
eukprot:CAMPEP_0172195340 /NCGR_PEP_ID=MMETSP1050-20130122/26145_1 /TAXON_ID=233186 /ORGANISM="Cryptomonas curvata, Strain CCAP979/52" /LENGTH=56 /DNA_ID=CAMNT_0012871375 /DNA_START=178 /DNA_END=345 /DNA_ORIENTATION=+